MLSSFLTTSCYLCLHLRRTMKGVNWWQIASAATTSCARSLPSVNLQISHSLAKVAICFLQQLPRPQQQLLAKLCCQPIGVLASTLGQLCSATRVRPRCRVRPVLCSRRAAVPRHLEKLPGGSWLAGAPTPPPSSSRHVIISDQSRRWNLETAIQLISGQICQQ